MRETPIQSEIIKTMGANGVYALRVNSGSFWGGKLVSNDGRYAVLENPTKVQGAAEGTSDVIGCKPTLITQEMVGKMFGRFVAIEVKIPTKKAKPQQAVFLANVKKWGGIAGVARSPEDAVRILNS